MTGKGRDDHEQEVATFPVLSSKTLSPPHDIHRFLRQKCPILYSSRRFAFSDFSLLVVPVVLVSLLVFLLILLLPPLRLAGTTSFCARQGYTWSSTQPSG